jgi:hypothetical protein
VSTGLNGDRLRAVRARRIESEEITAVPGRLVRVRQQRQKGPVLAWPTSNRVRKMVAMRKRFDEKNSRRPVDLGPRTSHRRQNALRYVVIICCVAAACKEEKPGQAGGAAGSSAHKSGTGVAGKGGTIPESTLASCAGFTTTAAAEFLSVPPADIQDMSVSTEATRNCRFVSKTQPGKKVGWDMHLSNTVADATASMAELRGGYTLAFKTPARQGTAAPFEEISGLGDEAFWTAINGMVVVRRANVMFEFLYPFKDKTAQVELAKKVLAGMPHG